VLEDSYIPTADRIATAVRTAVQDKS
jgi:hypothetical protein